MSGVRLPPRPPRSAAVFCGWAEALPAREDQRTDASPRRCGRLVVEDQRVGLPVPVALGLVQTLLEVCGQLDFAGDQHAAVEEERRLSPLDDLEALGLEQAAAQGR